MDGCSGQDAVKAYPATHADVGPIQALLVSGLLAAPAQNFKCISVCIRTNLHILRVCDHCCAARSTAAAIYPPHVGLDKACMPVS